jgi:hypothetical protein
MNDDEDRVGIISAACDFPGACVQDGEELESLWQVFNAKREELPFVSVPPERWTTIVKHEKQAALAGENGTSSQVSTRK